MIVGDAKVTSKNQITVPKSVRHELGLRAGDRIEFVKENGRLAVQKHITKSPFGKYRGYLKHLAGRRTDDIIEEMRGR